MKYLSLSGHRGVSENRGNTWGHKLCQLCFTALHCRVEKKQVVMGNQIKGLFIVLQFSVTYEGDAAQFRVIHRWLIQPQYKPHSFICSSTLPHSKMSGASQVAGTLVVEDYVVFALMLVVSTAIGVYYAWSGRGKENSKDFLTGGRRMSALPVSMSLTASFMSSITVLSNPVEVRLTVFYTKKLIWIFLNFYFS